jgi:hypothetical protein
MTPGCECFDPTPGLVNSPVPPYVGTSGEIQDDVPSYCCGNEKHERNEKSSEKSEKSEKSENSSEGEKEKSNQETGMKEKEPEKVQAQAKNHCQVSLAGTNIQGRFWSHLPEEHRYWMRICFASVERSHLAEAVKRIGRFVEDHRGK